MKRSSNNSGSDAANAKSSKRPREEEQTTPMYGTKEYWEARYKSHLPNVEVGTNNANAGKDSNSNSNEATTKNDDATYVLDGIELSTDAISPGHAWYFTYQDLRPLILPLLLGNEESEAEELESDCDDSDSWVEEEVDEEEAGDGIEDEEEEVGDGNEEEDEVAEEHPQDDEECADDAEDGGHDSCEMPIVEVITPPDKPKKVLEVGCGDVALGVDLAADLVKMQEDTDIGAELLVDEISCIDYSDIVVKTLIEKQKKEHNGSSSTLQASFHSLDARSLHYAPNTFDLVLEKGTLDAMLSDKDEGKQNCIQIVKEMARVTNIGGSILIVSHLNANESKGMKWLEDVVFSGLKAEFRERREAIKKQQAEFYSWSIHIHGGEGQLIKDEDDEEVMSYGPAVYIIKKKSVPADRAQELFSSKKKDAKNGESENGDETELTLPPVKVEFLTYD